MLSKLLKLEKIGASTYTASYSQDNFRKSLFGGQVLAQALMAAGQTTSRPVHSLHAYFLRAGKMHSPVIYEVATMRDGRSVSTRQVQALQEDKVIFQMQCSFHVEESGFEHQAEVPTELPDPDQLRAELSQNQQEKIERSGELLGTSPIEYVPVNLDLMDSLKDGMHQADLWMRAHEPLPEDPLTQSCVLAYASDMGPLATMLLPAKSNLFAGDYLPASMDHAIWFHQAPKFDAWHLYRNVCPWTGKARGLGFGAYYDRQGKLVATTAQEGLIRPLKTD